MPANTSIKNPEPTQPDVDTSSTFPSPQPGSLLEKVLSPCHHHLIVNSFAISNKTPFIHIYALNSPTLSYSFNFEEYIDESEISSSTISSQEILSDETKNQLKDMLPMLKKNIADLVQDADPVRRTFLAINDNLPLNLAKVLTPLSKIVNQAPRVKRAQRNLTNSEALLA